MKRLFLSVLFIAAVLVLVIGPIVSFHGFSEPLITYSESISIAPNETKNITIEAENVRHMAYGLPIDQREQLKVTSHYLNPSPRVTASTIPPAWTWKGLKQHVEINLQIKAALDANPGTYLYTVSAWDDLSHENESQASERIRVEVINNSAK